MSESVKLMYSVWSGPREYFCHNGALSNFIIKMVAVLLAPRSTGEAALNLIGHYSKH